MKCSRCYGEIEKTHKGRDTEMLIHLSTKNQTCPPFDHCPEPTRRHVLADGTLCPDPRHEENH